ncbi:hypothetical protein Bca4012_093715 [Brassica carinata]
MNVRRGGELIKNAEVGISASHCTNYTLYINSKAMEYEEDDLSEINTSEIDWGEEPDDLSDDGEDQEHQSCYETDSEISYGRHHEEVGDEPESLEQNFDPGMRQVDGRPDNDEKFKENQGQHLTCPQNVEEVQETGRVHKLSKSKSYFNLLKQFGLDWVKRNSKSAIFTIFPSGLHPYRYDPPHRPSISSTQLPSLQHFRTVGATI